MKKQPFSPPKPYQIAPDEDQMFLASMGATYPLPAPDILNTAPIPPADGRPAHGNLLDQYPVSVLVFDNTFNPLLP